MTDLPADDYIPDASRTEGEMKVALEKLRDRLAEMLSGGLGPESLTISGGIITPSRGWVKVDTEGGASSDDLVTIQATNLPTGSWLLLNTTDNGRDVVVKHATGNITLRDAADITLASIYTKMLLLYDGSNWIEIFTFWGGASAQRDYLGLGDAATADQGSGNGLDADLLDGQHASAFLGVGAKAADSDLLDGVDGANYARKDVASLQDFLGNIRAVLKLIANDPTTSTPQIELQDNGTRRGLLFFDGTNVILRLYESNGTTIDATLKITPTTIEWSPDGESTWYDLWHEGNDGSGSGLDADSVDSYEPAALASAAGDLPVVTLNSNYASGTLSAYDEVQISLNRFSFFPSFRANTWYQVRLCCASGTTPSPSTPEIGLRNAEDSSNTYDVGWEYLS